MKKTLLSLFFLASLGANAQIANGSTAPDFTVTDINGNSHTLSTYLSEGKDILLNVSATWCGPCWNYHNTHALGDFYEAYGPDGSNEAMVLYVEGDGSTPVTALYGQGSNTQGNWVEGTPYPIIDSSAIANQYQINYFPTLYRICASTGTTFELNQLTAINLRNNLNGACGGLQGVPNHAKIMAGSVYSCGTTGNMNATIRNFGNNNITSAVVVLKQDGNVIATQNFTGNVAQFSNGNVSFSSVTFSEGANYEAEIQSINGGAVHNSSFAVAPVNVVIAESASTVNLEVKVYTDNYAAEITWRIKNSAGNIVANGGPYQAGTADQWGGGGPDANTIKTHNITIPSSDDCYSIELLDSYGDGWGLSTQSFTGIEIVDSGDVIVAVSAAATFSNSSPLVRPGAFRYGTASTGENQLSKFSVYPNPSTGVFNISTTEAVDIIVVDVTGKTVYQLKNVQDNVSINLSSLQKGIYLIQVSGETIKTTEKLILN